jgi:hypothetical protein
LVASHRSRLGRLPMASDRSGPNGRQRGIFQRPVNFENLGRFNIFFSRE